MNERIIIKLGGSLLSPYEGASERLKSGEFPFDFAYAEKLLTLMQQEQDKKFAIVVGGGFLNRWVLGELKKTSYVTDAVTNDLHSIGMASGDINASIFRMMSVAKFGNEQVFSELVKYDMYGNLVQYEAGLKAARIVVAAGWKVGHSHDVDALVLAKFLGARQVLSFKNIDGVYTADPSKDPLAEKKVAISWQEYMDIIKVTEHAPGASYPIDPIAARDAEKNGVNFVVLDGRDEVAVKEAIETGKCSRGTEVQ